jgi:anti-sigma B factor antagonist
MYYHDFGRLGQDSRQLCGCGITNLEISDTLYTAMGNDKLQIKILDGTRIAEKVVVLQGVLNAETAFRFRDSLRPLDPTTMVIDMSGVRYVDSSGLGVLIGLYASFERNSKRLLLAGLNDRVWELFRICHIEDVFTRYRNVADAEQTISMEALPA